MKNNKFYLLLLSTFLSFLCLGVVSAAENPSASATVPYGQSVIFDFGRYVGVSCNNAGLSFTRIDVNGTGNAATVSWNLDKDSTQSGTETTTCSFTGYAAHVPESEQNSSRTIDVTINYVAVDNTRYHSFNLVKHYYESKDVSEDMPGVTEITSVTPNDGLKSGNKYVTANCSGVTCIFSMTSDFETEDGLGVAAGFTVTYKIASGAEYTIEYGIRLLSNTLSFAYPGSYSKNHCGLESAGWTKNDKDLGYYKKTNSSVSLPTCEADNSANPFIKFYGWVQTGEYSGTYQAPVNQNLDVCKPYATAGAVNSPTDPENNIYIACYESAGGVILSPNGSEVSYPGAIEKYHNLYIKTDSPVTLPAPTTVPALYNRTGNGMFVGWRRTSDNALYKSGDTVPADGATYVAEFSSGLSDGFGTLTKIVYLNENTNYIVSGYNITACQSSASVTATPNNGECVLRGNAETGDNYEDIVVSAGSFTWTLKVRVINRNFDGQYQNEADLELDDTSGLAGGDGTYTDSTSGVTVCETYKVTHDSWPSYSIGGGHQINFYHAKGQCSDANEYVALCMDPGRAGPSGAIYRIDQSFNRSSYFAKLIQYVAVKLDLKGYTRDNVAAANVALRIIEYASPEELAGSAGNIFSVEHYSSIGNKVAACIKNHKNNNAKYKTCVDKVIDDSWLSNDIKGKVKEFLDGFNTADVSDSVDTNENQITNEFTRTSEYSADGLTYTINYEGTMTFPSAANISDAEFKTYLPEIAGLDRSQSGIVGTVEKDGHTAKYKFKIVVDLTTLKQYDDGHGNKPGIEVTKVTGLGAQSVFVLKTDSSKQRMVIYDKYHNAKTVVALPIKVVCDVSKPPFDYKNPDRLNEDLFKKAGCCEFILDQTSDIFTRLCTIDDCTNSTFRTACDPKSTESIEKYAVQEAVKGDKLDFSCIVNVENSTDAISETFNKLDAAGNKRAVDNYSENEYCAVSCKEDWSFNLTSFKNFIGENAVAAGTSFAIQENGMFIRGERTCVSTYIDVAHYKAKVSDLSVKLVKAWNIHSEYTRVYSNLEESEGDVAVETKNYYTYELESSYDACDDGYTLSGTSCVQNKPSTWNDATDGTFTPSTISSHKHYKWKQSDAKECKVYTLKNKAEQFSKYAENACTSGVGATTGSGVSVPCSEFSYNNSCGSGSTISTNFFDGATAPSVEDSSSAEFDGHCGTSGYDYLLENAIYAGENVMSKIETTDGEVNTYRSRIKTEAKMFAACQNFKIVNVSDGSKSPFNKDSRDTEKMYSFGDGVIIDNFLKREKVTIIPTKFEPSVSYEYEEVEFQSILNKNKNSRAEQFNEYDLEQVAAGGKTKNDNEYKYKDSHGNTLYKNAHSTLGWSSSGWAKNSDAGKKYEEGDGIKLNNSNKSHFCTSICYVYSSGGMDMESKSFVGGGGIHYQYEPGLECYQAEAYYYNANYIRTNLINSSYYKNVGSWYKNVVNSVITHVAPTGPFDTIHDYKYASYDLGLAALHETSDTGRVSLFNTAYNVFPVSLTTPRNIYQYTYKFSDIGMYSDGKVGRIMGDDGNSLVPYNTYSCFYEVYEELCICCGRPIIWEATSNKLNETEQYLIDNSFSFVPSDPDDSNVTAGLGIFTSTVSNGTVADRIGGVASNWSSDSAYLGHFNDKVRVYATNQGEYLLSSITEKADKIYDEKPEYSYTLTPSTIQAIKNNYNSDHPYGFFSDYIEIVGQQVIDGSVDNNANNLKLYPKFVLYGSKFLKDYMKPYQNDEMAINVNSKDVCEVTNAAGVKQSYTDVQNGRCRFVVYKDSNDDGSSFRLAFK